MKKESTFALQSPWTTGLIKMRFRKVNIMYPHYMLKNNLKEYIIRN